LAVYPVVFHHQTSQAETEKAEVTGKHLIPPPLLTPALPTDEEEGGMDQPLPID
jgi:hypothetical protein